MTDRTLPGTRTAAELTVAYHKGAVVIDRLYHIHTADIHRRPHVHHTGRAFTINRLRNKPRGVDRVGLAAWRETAQIIATCPGVTQVIYANDSTGPTRTAMVNNGYWFEDRKMPVEPGEMTVVLAHDWAADPDKVTAWWAEHLPTPTVEEPTE